MVATTKETFMSQHKRVGPYGINYPWDKWFNRSRFSLKKGQDFHCQVHGMVQQIRNQATKRNVRVSVVVPNESSVHVEVLK